MRHERPRQDAESGSIVEVDFDRGGFRLSARIEWTSSSLVLFGPSGSGKTTLLRVILGLEPGARARVRIGGTELSDPEHGIDLPAHRRRLGWVPQSPTLLPDRNVLDNIRFAAPGGAAGRELDRAIEVLELGACLASPVDQLSGGQQQRVAIARAIASRPRALLLDEPLASLDLALRSRVLPFLLRIREELDLPLVHITHDPDEAILLGDEIAVLDAGSLVAQGDPRETLWSRAVLPLIDHLGLENWIAVRGIRGAGSDGNDRDETTRVASEGGLILETPWPVRVGEEIRLGLRGEDLLIALDPPGRLSARNQITGRVDRVEFRDRDALVHVDSSGEKLIAKLTARAARELDLRAGLDVFLIIKSQALRRI